MTTNTATLPSRTSWRVLDSLFLGGLVEERGLEHDVDAGSHRIDGVSLAATERREAVDVNRGFGDLGDAQPGIGQRGQVGGFVIESTALEDLELGVIAGGLVPVRLCRAKTREGPLTVPSTVRHDRQLCPSACST
ncbi:MAG: hypothetical protein ACYDB7_14090 [Mycobacteriales bacterium]